MRAPAPNRDHVGLGRPDQGPHFRARPARLRHGERGRPQSNPVPFDDGGVAGPVAGGQVREPRHARGIGGGLFDVDLAVLTHHPQDDRVVRDGRAGLVQGAHFERSRGDGGVGDGGSCRGSHRETRRFASALASSLVAPAGAPSPASPEISIVLRPPVGGTVSSSDASSSPSTLTLALRVSPGASPSNSARPPLSVLAVRLRMSPPALRMSAVTSTSATALTGILRATRTLTVPGGMPASGSGLPTMRARLGIPPAISRAARRCGLGRSPRRSATAGTGRGLKLGAAFLTELSVCVVRGRARRAARGLGGGGCGGRRG